MTSKVNIPTMQRYVPPETIRDFPKVRIRAETLDSKPSWATLPEDHILKSTTSAFPLGKRYSSSSTKDSERTSLPYCRHSTATNTLLDPERKPGRSSSSLVSLTAAWMYPWLCKWLKKVGVVSGGEEESRFRLKIFTEPFFQVRVCFLAA